MGDSELYKRDLLGELCMSSTDCPGTYMQVYPYEMDLVACTFCRKEMPRLMSKGQIIRYRYEKGV